MRSQTAEVVLPAAITVFPEGVCRAPETWARRAYPNFIYFNEVDKGGHFAAWGQPERFSEEVRAAFRPLRSPDPFAPAFSAPSDRGPRATAVIHLTRSSGPTRPHREGDPPCPRR